MSRRHPLTQVFTQMLIVTLVAIAIMNTAMPVQAITTGNIPVIDNTTVNPAEPSTTFTYSRNNFYITVQNIKALTYTVEYTRSSRTGDMLEGIQGAGKARKTTVLHRVGKKRQRVVVYVYSTRLYAGTQSSRYFIPHNVKSGSLKLSGTDLQGLPYSYTASFTIKRGRMVISG